jgi:superoxide dismutase, Cu-Zn family
MKKIALFIAAIGLALGVNVMAQSAEHEAQAFLKGTDGRPVGTVWFSQTDEGVKITAEIIDLAPGVHAFHIHGTGTCEAPSFKSAGGHYNPGNKQHGFLNSRGPHAGDMPNIVVGDTETYEWVTSLVSLYEAADNSLFPESGTAIVIHEKPDDYITDPAGRGGPRIACGVIEKISR